MELVKGTDFRENKYRREVFLRFYEFHLKYKAHAGAVYYVFPALFEHYNMTVEQKLWFVYINGITQNVITTWLIWKRYPNLETLDIDDLDTWFNANWHQLAWDTDRRYVKSKLITCVKNYATIVYDSYPTQEAFFNSLNNTNDVYQNFRQTWTYVMKNFAYFGRLASFSYLEYLRLAGIRLDCDNLFITDLNGSRSHRNGIAKVLGREDLDWYNKNIHWKGNYTKEDFELLTKEGEALLEEAKARIDHEDVSYFTLETTLCCYKGWHRPNRRYPNVYNDMFAQRITSAEGKWQGLEDFSLFWKIRKDFLPQHLRTEDHPLDSPLKPVKQNHYLTTGQVIMMDKEWDCFENWYNDTIK